MLAQFLIENSLKAWGVSGLIRPSRRAKTEILTLITKKEVEFVQSKPRWCVWFCRGQACWAIYGKHQLWPTSVPPRYSRQRCSCANAGGSRHINSRRIIANRAIARRNSAGAWKRDVSRSPRAGGYSYEYWTGSDRSNWRYWTKATHRSKPKRPSLYWSETLGSWCHRSSWWVTRGIAAIICGALRPGRWRYCSGLYSSSTSSTGSRASRLARLLWKVSARPWTLDRCTKTAEFVQSWNCGACRHHTSHRPR